MRGGGPGTRETDLLDPANLVQRVDAVCLTGGSAYGLAAATGVVDWLAERNLGLPIGSQPHHVVPIVPAAVLFDLGLGGRFDARPDAVVRLPRRRRGAAGGRVRQGTVGAGTGAHAGGLKGGIGTASAVLDNGITVAALVAANPGGSPVEPDDRPAVGRPLRAGRRVRPPPPAERGPRRARTSRTRRCGRR